MHFSKFAPPLPEGPAVEGGRQGHDGVDHGQQAEEEDEQQQAHVEVVGLGGLEDPLVGHVGGHHRPALVVHGGEQPQHVDAHQPRGVERPHPETHAQTHARTKTHTQFLL